MSTALHIRVQLFYVSGQLQSLSHPAINLSVYQKFANTISKQNNNSFNMAEQIFSNIQIAFK
jgi:hypothetical protein